MKSGLTQNWLVCRICLKQPKEVMQAIFDNNEEKDLTQMILECGGVAIKQFDHYPDKICCRCLRYLRVAYKFRVTCQRSHQHLGKYIAPVQFDADAEQSSHTEVEHESQTELDVEQQAEVETEPDLDMEPEVTSMELNDNEELTLKLEPSDVPHIKEEYDNIDGEIDEMYEPIEEDFKDFEEEFDAASHAESFNSDEIEYLDDFGDVLTSDEEYVPNAKTSSGKKVATRIRAIRKVVGNKSIKKEPEQRATTSNRATLVKREPQKRGPKPKKKKETSFICDVCGNIYPSQGRLTEHIKLHKGIKPHICEICGHAFAQTQQLARHMNTHTGNRPFKCSYCPAAFADLSTRNKHHRIHTNERPYVCDVCGKAFTYTNTLKFHKMIHTGEKPHVCDICGKGFLQAYKLRNHKLTHERKGIKLEKIEVETLTNYQEINIATAHILEI